MKNEMLNHAIAFAKIFTNYLAQYRDFSLATDMFNYHEGAHLTCVHGAVRRVVLCNDFVIKWDYDARNVKCIGGCEREYQVYQSIKQTAYSYLFAEIAPIKIGKKTYWVMPRVTQMGWELEDCDIDSYLSDEEKDFLYEDALICDLHPRNWGLVDGHPVIIDYACGPESAS